MFGFMGKMLFVNLSDRTYEVRELPELWAKNFLGGNTLGSRVLWEYMPPNVDAFSEESMIGFVAGTCNDNNIFFGGRYTVVCKSPVYNGWSDSNSGGFFGPALKGAGYDAVFVNGIASSPVYIFIDDGNVEIRDAAFMWGKNIPLTETEQLLYKDVGDDKVRYAMIGTAGETRSLMAAVMNDTHRAAARGGPGAVMGSKMLKAIVCRGKQKPEVFDRNMVQACNKAIQKFYLENPLAKAFSEHGTTAATVNNIKSGDCMVKNFSSNIQMEKITGDEFVQSTGIVFNPLYKRSSWGCAVCPMKCGAILDIPDERWPMKHVARPEYESLGWWTAGIMCSDFPMIAKCNDLCNEYGMDTVSCGGTIGWVYEAFNEGILTKDELDGIEPYWGAAEASVALVEKMGKGEGVGAILVMGSQYAANHFGKGHECLALASGMEISAHDARRAPGFARTYQYDPSPGRHTKGGASGAQALMSVEERYDFRCGAWTDFAGVINNEFMAATGFCLFGTRQMPPTSMFDCVEAVTGWAFPERERYFFAMRSFTSRQIFNMREGLRRKDFWISDKLLGRNNTALKDGPYAHLVIDNERQCDNLYNLLGYNYDGMPRKDALIFMGGMEHAIDEFYNK